MVLDSHKVNLWLANKGMTKTELAQKCGISCTGLCNVLVRGRCNPVTAGKIANGLGVSVEEIVKEV